jgi:pimeloyl-[acyl-carrier protein] methyl ester esterase
MHSGLWGSLTAELAGRFRVHAVDLPGHGHSAGIAPYTLDALASAMAERFDRESQPLTVLGWSLGGIVAMRWARREPDRVAALVLVGTTPRFVAGDGWPHAMTRETLHRFGEELRACYRLTLQRFLTLQMGGSDVGQAALRTLRKDVFARGEPAPAVLIAALALLGSADLRADVPSLRQRTLVVAGDRDTLAPFGAAEWLSRAIPDARFAPIPGAAHLPFLSHPRAFNAALTGFFDEASAGPPQGRLAPAGREGPQRQGSQ